MKTTKMLDTDNNSFCDRETTCSTVSWYKKSETKLGKQLEITNYILYCRLDNNTFKLCRTDSIYWLKRRLYYSCAAFKSITQPKMTTLFDILDCVPGYNSLFCNLPCKHPQYGENCQRECNCNLLKCHHIKGCLDTAGKRN